ncbi:hypothetical protein L1857_11440 [Amycolatopsis thermalba]|uniref:Uncharacterized protein n=1 Tax=Amycolatopsis thermalba TaxID=944492 RepID=A0ABY4NTL6_9PSEU|nr:MULTISPECIES: hypothetical protein [Amycolatopsis]UQS23390.1 hypothetical protein L1857_11440 [Amycolatopsis thermalba]
MDDYDIGQHPDLRDPDWQRHAVKEAWVDLRRQRRRARMGKRLAWTGVSLVVVAGAVFGFVQWGRSTSAHYDGSAPPAAEMRPTAPSVLPDLARVNLERPFDGTPAETWGESVDSLLTPPPGPVGKFSAGEVQNAVAQVKEVIRAGRLDRRTIEGHDGSLLLNLLAPNARPEFAKAITDRTEGLREVVSFAEDGYRLLPAGPRITGTITAAPGREPNTLALHADYSVAYAFDPGSHAPILGPGDIDVFLRYEVDFELVRGTTYQKNDRGLWVTSTQGVVYSMACEPSKRGYLAPAYSEPYPDDPEAVGFDEAAMYDVTKPMPEFTGGCE